MNRIPQSRDIARAILRQLVAAAHLRRCPRGCRALGSRRSSSPSVTDREHSGSLLILAIAAAVAERGSVRFTDTTELSISPVLMLFAAVLFGPLAGGLVGAASELGDSELLHRVRPGRSPRLKWLTYTSSRFIIGAATGGIAQAVLSVGSDGVGGVILATLVGSIVSESLELTFAMATSRLRGNRTSFSARTLAPLLATAVLVYAPVVALLTLAYTEISPWTAPLFIAPCACRTEAVRHVSTAADASVRPSGSQRDI